MLARRANKHIKSMEKEAKKRVRVYTEDQKARKRETERLRRENPEYVARKNELTRIRMQNKEVRDRKRALDRERRKAPEVSARKLEASKKWRGTDKYKEWASERAINKHMKWLSDNTGKVCRITIIRCLDCSVANTYPSYKVDHLRLKSKYCESCGQNHSQYEGVVIKKVDVICVDCGDVCQGTRQKKVCESCRKSRIKERKRNSEKEAQWKKDRGGPLRRRARIAGAYMDTVNVRKVYERDKWRCVSCRCKVERTRHHQPNRATIDHRIPLSRGGSHTYENCHTMCVMCNSKKEASMPVDVQLTVFDRVG